MIDDCRGAAALCLRLHPALAEDLADVQLPVAVRLQSVVGEVLAHSSQVLGAEEVAPSGYTAFS